MCCSAHLPKLLGHVVWLSLTGLSLLKTGCSNTMVPSPSCTVDELADGSVVIRCPDGTSVIVEPGADGPAGEDGEDGKSCAVTNHCNGFSEVNCEDGTHVKWRTGRLCAVSAGTSHTCGIGLDGSVECWGWGVGSFLYGSDFTDISVSPSPISHTCGVIADAIPVCSPCSGDVSRESICSIPAEVPPNGLSQITTGSDHTCGLTQEGEVLCWGWDIFGQLAAPSGEFLKITAGWNHTCGLRADRTIACWGKNDY
ncbi:MAG: hypothetical protein GF331_11130, partial [Chitinivibrionales bacterium]|nr:hypothetical protein [Chitinivibrionales bacterium]